MLNTRFAPLDPEQAPLAAQLPCLGFQVDQLYVYIYADRAALGQAAAAALASEFRRAATETESLSVIFAAAPSQDETLAALVEDPTVPWAAVRFAGQMDEYLELPADDSRSFRYYHNTHLWGLLLAKGRALDPAAIQPLRGDSPPADAEAARYAELLRRFPPQIVQGGIGEVNAHLAFNDPPAARFDDPELVKVIEVAPAAKQQQVNEGHFARVEEIPRALTLTVPALTRFSPAPGREHTVSYWSCVAPGAAKASAVAKLLLGEITEQTPGSILRTLPHAALFLDVPAAAELQGTAVDLSSLGWTP
ncbi:MAG TPA: glucosamine-6-phosphate deaminase [Armatimonadota bacterium]|jgi:glucosamine-6-phosphate deaminase